MTLWADEEIRRFRQAQQTAIERARDLPAEQGRKVMDRLARQEARWLKRRKGRR